MKNFFRVLFFSGALVGSAWVFRLWALNNFESVFTTIATTQPSETMPANVLTSEISSEIVPTLEEEQPTVVEEKEVVITPKVTKFSFTAPTKEAVFYQGCTYKITWASPVSISTIDFELIDAGKREAVDTSIKSGLPKNSTGTDLETTAWKVGNIWPGKYYILSSQINESDDKQRSEVFNIAVIPSTVDASKKDDFCKEQWSSKTL